VDQSYGNNTDYGQGYDEDQLYHQDTSYGEQENYGKQYNTDYSIIYEKHEVEEGRNQTQGYRTGTCRLIGSQRPV